MAVDSSLAMMPYGVKNVPMVRPKVSPDHYASKDQIMALKETLIARYWPRDRDLRTLVNAYLGNFYLQDDINAMDADGRPLLRDTGGDYTQFPTVVNLLKGFADSFKRMLVDLPDINFSAPGNMLTDQQARENYSSKMVRGAYGLWDASEIQSQQIEAAWWGPVCGFHGEVVLPDWKLGHAVIKYVAPWNFYGVAKMGDRRTLSCAVIRSIEDPFSVQRAFKGREFAKFADTQQPPNRLNAVNDRSEVNVVGDGIEHIIYLDDEWFVRIVGGVEVGRHFHGLGYCPAQVAPFITIPNLTMRGLSAIEQLIPMQYSANYGVSLWEEGMKENIFGTLVIEDPQNVPSNFKPGTGQTVTTNPGGKAYKVSGDGQALNTVRNHLELMREVMEVNSGVSRVAIEGSAPGLGTGRAIDQAQGPYLAGITEILLTRKMTMQRSLAWAMQMSGDSKLWEAKDDGSEIVTFTGMMGAKAVFEQISRAELATTPKPDIVYSGLAGMGTHELVNVILQALSHDPPLIPWEEAQKRLPFVRDIALARQQIKDDTAWTADIIAQKARAAAGTASPPGPATAANPADAAASVEAGATNQTTLRQAAALPPAPAAPTGGTPTAVPLTAAGGAVTPPSTLAGPGGAAPAEQPVPMDLSKALAEPLVGKRPPTGLETRRTPAEDVAAIVATLTLQGDVYVNGKMVNITSFRDAAKVKAALAKAGLDFAVKVVSKNPKGEKVTAGGG